VQVRFLLGPAGSGKTFRCLNEIRAALAQAPDGPPLILLAPKQATFQLERQLLADGGISGFARLQILSFDRLAQFIFEKLNLAPPQLLSAEGRLMVLRALLRQHDGELKLFNRSARRAGFAQELGALLAELQQHQLGPAKLRALAANEKLRRELRDKLADLALLSEKYAGWLRQHDLQDANNLLDIAAGKLRQKFQTPNSKLQISGLWLDGFAEMTPQEMDLLTAAIPFCKEATLAFCLEHEPTPAASWLSIWSAIGKTFQQCRAHIATLPECEIETGILHREPGENRFAKTPELQLLEGSWTLPASWQSAICNLQSAISIAACANPEAEAVFAAREILKFVRAGNRFRDCAVIVRDLEHYHRPLGRVFRRYEIPFFLDRRESVAHHPLAELTRSTVRTAAFDWQHDDWFAALKAGFCTQQERGRPARALMETELDRLENAALEFGWRGKQWREPLPDERCERLRQLVFPPFEKFHLAMAKLNFQPNGVQLAAAVRGLWNDLDVEEFLENWSAAGSSQPANASRQPSIHSAVLEQMNSWLKNLEMAFPREPLPLREWLPVLEAGLANLTVGVIPPALDEVLAGAIDRARNPDLKFALLLGFNESVFPAAPAAPVILTASDRDELEKENAAPGQNRFDQISRERFLGYIACTRASEKLAVTFARQDENGRTLNPSPFIAQLRRVFPDLPIQDFSGALDWRDAEHAIEVVAAGVTRLASSQSLLASAATNEIPALKALVEKLSQLREPDARETLAKTLAEKLHGPVLKSSVSRLEEFAQCPFRFFVRSGLRANERKIFELDARERGNFQHEVLKEFHEQLAKAGKRWRDLTPAEARERISKIAEAQMGLHRDGLFRDSAETLFAARAMAAALQDFIEVIVGWMRGQYEFDPAKAELGFGGEKDSAPAWEIDLGDGRKLALQGRIDRVDLWRPSLAAAGEALAVVVDYKSGGKKLDSLLLANGIQLQLLAYLGALRRWKNPLRDFGVEKIVPAGAFYVNLRGEFESGGSRAEVLANTAAKVTAYRHNGRFDAGHLREFDSRGLDAGDQFNFRLNQNGTVRSNCAEAISGAAFADLLNGVENQLRSLGERIFAGESLADPFRKGGDTACEYCDYRAICRIDEWTHKWRDLKAAKAGD
jgi:ATP-dependent helicase/nuclease subunit B